MASASKFSHATLFLRNQWSRDPDALAGRAVSDGGKPERGCPKAVDEILIERRWLASTFSDAQNP
jgi:hypothetical protein